MAKWKAGDRVRIVNREVKAEDHLSGLYYGHMAGLSGTVTSVFDDSVGVKVDPESFDNLLADVHKVAVKRMRAKFLDSLSEEQRRKLSPEEKRFDANYVLLVSAKDLEKGPPAPKPTAKKDVDEDDEYDGTSVVQGALYDDATIPESPKRRTADEIAEAEEEELKRRMN
ncbi:MAG: hypothetical protein KIT74_02145 [Fimbriimonadales bacterium]|nr:hypothetical protein [Fimbriimonadales bacterium]